MRVKFSTNCYFLLIASLVCPLYLAAEPLPIGQEYLPPKAFDFSQQKSGMTLSGCVYSSRKDKSSSPFQFLFPTSKSGECVDPANLDYSAESIKVKRGDNSVVDGKRSRIVYRDESSKERITVEAEPMTDRNQGNPKITIGSKEYTEAWMPERVRVIVKSEDGTEKKVEFCQRLIKTGKFPKYEVDYLLSEVPPEQDRCYDLIESQKHEIKLREPNKKMMSQIDSAPLIPHAKPAGVPVNDHDSYATATQPSGRPIIEDLPAL